MLTLTIVILVNLLAEPYVLEYFLNDVLYFEDSNEDLFPTEPSPAKEEEKKQSPYQQAPPQRVRQPPGGFSTKLW